jgi:pimeloyl-ACP methyl ester carboxylesterase
MYQFRRIIRLVLLFVGVIVGMITASTFFIIRMLISPPRQALWATPADLGMPFENVQFPARDGIRLSGWFIPGQGAAGEKHGITLVMVHGWPWNRLGTAAETILTDLPGSSPVQLIHLAHALHGNGYQLLMFDLRNHGQSANGGPVTFGLREARDLLGALDYLSGRPDVNRQQIGVIGFSLGANALLYALPQVDLIRAAVAVQPTSAPIFLARYTHYLLGPLSKPVVALVSFIYQALAGLRLNAIDPLFAVAGAGDTPVLYVQGTGDPWGSVDNVKQMIQATPNAVHPQFVETSGRYGGYQFVLDNPELISSFFMKQMAPDNRC